MRRAIVFMWGVMMVALIYSSRELGSSKSQSVVTSTTHLSVMPKSKISDNRLHEKTTYRSTATDLMGHCCKSDKSYFHSQPLLSESKSLFASQQQSKSLPAVYLPKGLVIIGNGMIPIAALSKR